MNAARPCSDEQGPAGHCRACLSLPLLLAALFVSLTVRSAAAQEPRVTWGRIPPEDLAMTSFPADTNARAVVLYDYGELSYNQHDDLCFFRHQRVKILSQAAYDRWGTVAIPYLAGTQRVSDIEASTTVLAPDGSERHFDLDRASIFDEKVTGKFRRLRFTMPGLAPGCVIEYRYRVNPSFLYDWVFQWDEPVVWSEFRMERPKGLEYTMVQQCIGGFSIEESREIPNLADVYRTRIAHRWVLRDVPALRREPFMTTPADFRATLRFQMSRWMDGSGQEREILGTWEKMASELMGSENFGGQLDPPGSLRKTARDLVRNLTDPEEEMRRIYNYVRSTLTWTGEYSAVADGTLEHAVAVRRGNSAESGLLLTGMLRAAGLKADPVLVSTRDHGRVVDVFPLTRQFNHVLAHVQVGKTEYLLDATDPLRPWDLLPEAALNGTGFLLSRDDPGWVDIVSHEPVASRTSVTAALSADGTISGRLEARDEGYRALESRHALRDMKEEEFVRGRWLGDFADARLDSFTVANKDSIDAPLITKVWFSASGQAQVAGNRIYLNPLLFNRLKENPLVLPQRSFPVDFAHGSVSNYTLNLTLPEGYRVEERPQDLRLTLGHDAGQFVRSVQGDGNTLTVTVDREIRKPVFQPDEYRGLRDYFNRLVAAQGEQLVLVKIGTAGGAR